MTGNTPKIPPDDSTEDSGDVFEPAELLADESALPSEEPSELFDGPDLLSANIDALMGGSEAPTLEPINLDEYPYKPDDEVADDPVQAPGTPLEEAAEPQAEARTLSDPEGEFIQAPEEQAEEPDAVLDEPGATVIELGFYGKLPAYGDFIQKRLPQDFVNPWHEWVQAAILACRGHDPDGWLTYYLNCPAWCFVLGEGICGEQPVAGVTIPSVDRVGRYFNFTMASILPFNTDPAVFAGARQKWFKDLEVLALSVLDQEMNQDDIDRAINERSAELTWAPPASLSFEIDEHHARISGNDAVGMGRLLPGLLHGLISRGQDRYGLWWHKGSSQATAQLVSCARMPVGGTYLELIMDRELRDAPESTSREPEVDYMDELLSR